MRRSLLLAALSITLSASLGISRDSAVTRLDGSQISATEIDATVTRLMQAAHVTGVGIAIFNHGHIDFIKAYGMRDKEKNLPLTLDSVMTAASLTKSAFATVVMQLVQEGVLDLDRHVYEYLPRPLPEYASYADLRDDPRYKKITMRMLLSHTSGFPNWRALTESRKLNINFIPGSRFAYSGEGIDLAQLVVETLTRKPLTEWMRERLFEPLGMTRTSMVWESRFESDFANGYDQYGRSLGPEKWKRADAAGSMQTTLRDYAQFIQAVLSGRVLNSKMREVMLSSQIQIFSKHEFPSLSTETTAANRPIRLSYGLGWGLYWSPRGKAFFKEGHDEGWRHYTVCFDALKTGILIMTNSSNGEGIYEELLKTLLRDTYTPIEWEGFTPYGQLPPLPPLKQHKEVAIEPALLDRHVGRYQFSPEVILTVTRHGDHLFVQENDEPKQQLAPESETEFFSKVADDEYRFETNASGRAIAMILHTNGKDIRIKRVE